MNNDIELIESGYIQTLFFCDICGRFVQEKRPIKQSIDYRQIHVCSNCIKKGVKQMPKIIVQIEWDLPDEIKWLNADNIAIALKS